LACGFGAPNGEPEWKNTSLPGGLTSPLQFHLIIAFPNHTTMGQQLNKIIKRKRRAAYLKRRKAAAAASKKK
jgi:hypothetical protein